MTICDRTFELVVEYLAAVNYEGPITLSCDNTKLLSALRIYWDSEKESHFLVGAVGGPIQVPDPDNVKALMNDPTLMKATKVSHILANLP